MSEHDHDSSSEKEEKIAKIKKRKKRYRDRNNITSMDVSFENKERLGEIKKGSRLSSYDAALTQVLDHYDNEND